MCAQCPSPVQSSFSFIIQFNIIVCLLFETTQRNTVASFFGSFRLIQIKILNWSLKSAKERINGYCNWKWLLGFWLFWILKHLTKWIVFELAGRFLKQFRSRVSCGLQKSFKNDFWESSSYKLEDKKQQEYNRCYLLQTYADTLANWGESERKTENE